MPAREIDRSPTARKIIRRAIEIGDDTQLYAMVPAMYGGQTNEMTCKYCGGYGNVMGGSFFHETGCPVETEERLFAARKNRWPHRAGRAMRRLFAKLFR